MLRYFFLVGWKGSKCPHCLQLQKHLSLHSRALVKGQIGVFDLDPRLRLNFSPKSPFPVLGLAGFGVPVHTEASRPGWGCIEPMNETAAGLQRGCGPPQLLTQLQGEKEQSQKTMTCGLVA